ncbi:Methyltransferase domain-containing protein [Halpernia frigidisoli]|uniref:Methyltransferase domain-containing protein n=2 Tax=Halpernia frigidisoli TaxID=1125876 RepID=A0A1I3EG63_9FLAO|nr:Methyltransferase domain-containing protein [Halpernia frigidisoli]
MVYNILKNTLKSVFPKKVLFKYEDNFRKILYPFYKGENCACNICGSKLKNFEKLENGNLLCPVCGSLPRTRRLWKIVNEDFMTKKNISVLDFSPSRSIFKKLSKNSEINYFPTDFSDEFLSVYHYDITKIEAESDKFDLIMCYHILEHIDEDAFAMAELFRVLKPGGTCLIQTPFKEGEIYEDDTKKSEKQRLEFFGQEDHVRIYSVNGLKQRLENAGFNIEIKKFEEDVYLGLNKGETVIFAKKN